MNLNCFKDFGLGVGAWFLLDGFLIIVSFSACCIGFLNCFDTTH